MLKGLTVFLRFALQYPVVPLEPCFPKKIELNRATDFRFSFRLTVFLRSMLLDCGRNIREIRSPRSGAAQMDEPRKRVLGIMAAILAARKLAQYDGGAKVPATIMAIEDAVRWAEQIMRAIDERWTVEDRR